MTPLATAMLALAALAAAVDWWAAWTGRDRVRPLSKTATMALLVGVALAIDPRSGFGPARAFVVAAGVLSLLGDVLLLPQVDVFEAGLGAFLLAHVAYVVAFTRVGLDGVALAVIATVAAPVLLFPVLRRIVAAVRRDSPPLVVPVIVYVAAICTMAGSAVATREPRLALGALVFVASDAQLAWDRFVHADRRLSLGVIVTYHLAQALLVTGLA